MKARGIPTWPAERRFWRNVDKSGDCWIWTGGKTVPGYGVLQVDGKRKYAHRYSYELHYGHIATGNVICHACDNPSCVNPAHLFQGTVADNNRDMWKKGRGKGLDPHHGKLSKEQRAHIVALVNSGMTKTDVAKQFGVTRQAVNYLVKAGTYA